MASLLVETVWAHATSPRHGQFLRFCLVGTSGYLVNLGVYTALLAVGLHYAVAATGSFVVASGSNYVWNRLWTFRTRSARVLAQGLRALTVSSLSLGANQLFLVALIAFGADHVPAEAAASLIVAPFSFLANRLWAFTDGHSLDHAAAGPARADA